MAPGYGGNTLSGPQLTWVNLQVDDFLIEELLSEGTFSWVYRGVHMDRAYGAAFKVAKPPEYLTAPAKNAVLPSQALEFYTGGVAPAKINPFALLAKQAQMLLAVDDAAVIKVEDLMRQEGMCYLRMELLP